MSSTLRRRKADKKQAPKGLSFRGFVVFSHTPENLQSHHYP